MTTSKKLEKKLQKLSGTKQPAQIVLGDFDSIAEIQGIGNPPDGAIATVSDSAALYTYDADTESWTISAGGSGIAELAADATPQLGGDLDLNNNDITGSGNINITGTVTSNGFSTTGNITVNGTVDDRDIAIDGTKLDGVEANADVTDEANVIAALNGATLTDIGTPVASEKIFIQDSSDSNNLKYVEFSEFGGGGGGSLNNVVEDTTPQLGGNLDLNTNDITGTGDINITGNISLSGTVDSRDVAGDGTKLDLLNIPSSLSDIGTPTSSDKIIIQDASDSSNLKTVNFSEIDGPSVSTGSAAPVSTPGAEGDMYVDTTNDNIYFATGTASANDWQEQVVVDGTSLSDGEILIWDASNGKFVRDNRTTGTTAVTTIDMNSIMGNFYSTTTASTASSYALQNVLAGGKSTIRIQEATSGGPAFAGSGLTIQKKGDWSNDYDTTNVNIIYLEAVTSTLIWAFIASVEI